MEITGEPCEALLDSGASRSFINPVVVERLGLKSTCLPTAHCFTMANGEPISVDRVVYALTIVCNGRCFTGDYLVGPTPYDLILGLDWLKRHGITWSFSANTLYARTDGGWCQLLAICKTGTPPLARHKAPGVAGPAEDAYHALAQQVSQMTTAKAASLLRPPPKRYNHKRKAKARVPIEALVREAHANNAKLRTAAEGLNGILAVLLKGQGL